MSAYVGYQNASIDVKSYDDPWEQDCTHWSHGEREVVVDIITFAMMAVADPQVNIQIVIGVDHAINHMPFVQITCAQPDLLSAPAAQRLADAICRLVRPDRYKMIRSTKGGAAHTVMVQQFNNTGHTPHQRIAAWQMLRDVADEAGRTPEGIQAAIDVLSERDFEDDVERISA